jgi:hypothetical protein
MIFLSFVFGFSLALLYERQTAKYGDGIGTLPWVFMAVATGGLILVAVVGSLS